MLAAWALAPYRSQRATPERPKDFVMRYSLCDRRAIGTLLLLLCGACGQSAATSHAAADVQSSEDAAATDDAMGTEVAATPATFAAATSVFDSEGIHTIAIDIVQADWFDLLAQAKDANLPRTWHSASVTFDGQPYAQVGVRTFGDGSMVANPKKPNIRLGFDHFDSTLEGPEGLHGLRLKASGADPTFLREPLAYRMLAAAGAPSRRWSWARVTVAGTYYGLYQVIEHVDKQYFTRVFGNKDGNSYSALNLCQGLQCAEPDCADVPAQFQLVAGDGNDLVALALAITTTPAAGLKAKLAKLVDLDGLLAVYATESVAADFDALTASGTNFDLYRDSATGRLAFIRGGADATFAGDYDFWQPWGDLACPGHTDVLFKRIRDEVPELKAALTIKMRGLQCGVFAKSAALAWISHYQERIVAERNNDHMTQYKPADAEEDFMALKTWIVERGLGMVDRAEFGPCPK